ncbi:MAG: TetR/AcrR family transcriptional regulator [Kiloniellales bacterium]
MVNDKTTTKSQRALRSDVDLRSIGRYTDFLERELDRREFSSKGERTRFRLKLAAAKALEASSFPDLKVADVCQNAEVALGTFYVYFPDKSAIATEVLLDFGDELYAQAQRVARGSNDFEAILLTNQFFVAAYRMNSGLIRCLVQLEDQVPEFRLRWRERRLQWLGQIAFSLKRRTTAADTSEHLRLQVAYALEGMVFQYLYDVFVRQEPTLSRFAGKPEYIAELLSVLWYRAVYCENPPADQVFRTREAMRLRRKPASPADRLRPASLKGR